MDILKTISTISDPYLLKQIMSRAAQRRNTLYKREVVKKIHEAKRMAALLGADFEQLIKDAK